MVQNIDYAPTFLDVAGTNIPSKMEGLSLKPLMENPSKAFPRKRMYYHYYEYPFDHSVLTHIGVRTDRCKLIYFYIVNERQLFDLQKDTAELNNLMAN